MPLSRPTISCAHTAAGNLNSKRIIVCCDGTWNNSNDNDSPATNVSRLAGAFEHKCCSGKPQVVYYHPGAGTEASWVAQKLGGLLGLGVVQDIAETYRFICDNYSPGDEIILLGFSRGAFTARSVADMICNLGFLNRAGLDHLADIFHDYSTWEEWKNEGSDVLDTSKYLVGFSLANYDQMRRRRFVWEEQEDANKEAQPAQNGAAATGPPRHRERKTFQQSLEAAGKLSPEQYAEGEETAAYEELLARKQKLWRDIRNAPNRSAIAELYRKELAEQRLSVMRKIIKPGEDAVYEACLGEVHAVAVWDTVGSLGVPKGPWRAYAGGRSNDEIRFASLEMHANVRHAFHALALDEYRTAFSPTLWERSAESETVLRQVWFAGNHGDVGGGWADEQSANVALAWMADQLASVGVEFSRAEMQRVFYDVAADAVPERWAMGDIHDPPMSTAAADVVWSGLTRNEPAPRRPGLYVRDAAVARGMWAKIKGVFGRGEAPAKLSRTHELVHPSVRIRYQCGGRGPSGEPTYRCRALIDNGYSLQETAVPKPRPAPTADQLGPLYGVVGGTVATFRNDEDLGGATLSGLRDGTALVRVQLPDEQYDVLDVPPAKRGWVWRRPARGDEEAVELAEEQIGMWERLYMEVQEELVEWRPLYEARRRKLAAAEAEKKTAVTRAAGAAAAGVGGALSAGLGAVGGWWLGKDAGARVFLPWGYHDLVVWMRGDVREWLRVRAAAT